MQLLRINFRAVLKLHREYAVVLAGSGLGGLFVKGFLCAANFYKENGFYRSCIFCYTVNIFADFKGSIPCCGAVIFNRKTCRKKFILTHRMVDRRYFIFSVSA